MVIGVNYNCYYVESNYGIFCIINLQSSHWWDTDLLSAVIQHCKIIIEYKYICYNIGKRENDSSSYDEVISSDKNLLSFCF